MSYHYRPNNKRQDLLRELSQVDRDISNKNQNLERLKLEAEFYEDKGKPLANQKMSLADQIMNQIISGPPVPTKNNYKLPEEPISIPRKVEQYKQAPVIPSYAPQIERQNNFINQRQIQKNKLQNQKHEGLFPNSSDHNRVRSFGKQQQQPIPQNDNHQRKLNQFASNNPQIKRSNSPNAEQNYNADYNPFVKADELQKQKREEAQKQYLKDLEIQRQQQQRLKQQREKQKKMFKGQFYDFLPPPKQELEKPMIMKKADPNSKPPKVQQIIGNYSQFDTNLIKSKASQIRTKYKKGKISYEECQRELNNLRKQYDGNLDDLLADSTSINPNKFMQKQPNEKLKLYKEQSPKKQFFEEEEKKEVNPTSFPIRNQSINYSQFMPSSLHQQQMAQQHNLHSSLPHQNMMGNMGNIPMMGMMGGVPANVPQQYMELVKKIFEVCIKEVKQAYTQKFESQDKAYQQTINKFLQHSTNNFMTQQIPPIQASQQQKQFYSDAKQAKEFFDKESNIKKKVPTNSGESLVNIPFGQSDNSQYYDKSLSGIASKIPYNGNSVVKIRPKIEKEQKVLKQSGVQEFFNRKYKVKKLQKFPYLTDPNQSQLQIPSTSTYLRSKNAMEELQIRFHEDLAELKKIQAQKSINEATNKIVRNTTYSNERRVLVDPVIQPVASGNPSSSLLSKNSSKQNPFLKKHISNDDNIMTFNQKELKMSSPINNYSPKSKKEILQQDQYQTQPRVREEAKVTSYMQQYEQRLKMPSKALEFIKIHNQALNQYTQAEQQKKSAIIKEVSANKEKESYFTNNDISPVKKSQNYYEESMETIKSDFQSGRFSKRQPKIIDSVKDLIYIDQESKHEDREIPPSRLSPAEMAAYQHTIESIEQSSIKNSRPPVAKKRHVSKKKESSIARSKIGQQASQVKSFNNDSVEEGEAPQFDSNLYESQEEESADFGRGKPINPQLIKNASIERNQLEPNIQVYPPTIIAPKSALEIQSIRSNLEQKSPKANSAKIIQAQPQAKLKSLEEARKLARQYRAKATDESKQYKSVEERFSELESFITKRGDESVHSIKKEQGERAKQAGKRDIMKMLEALQDQQEEYKQDFESYREESQQYQ